VSRSALSTVGGFATAIALMTAGCSPAPPVPPLRWLAAGDSFSSAEGVPDPRGDCARTVGAYAPRAREEVDRDLGVASFAHVACTRAGLADFPLQWAEAGGGRFDLVTFTLGGNDAGFGDLLRDCLGQDDLAALIPEILDGSLVECDATLGELFVAVDRVAAPLDQLLTQIETEVLTERGQVVVLGYPQLFAPPEEWRRREASRCEGFERESVVQVRRAGERLESVLRAAVAEHPRARFLSVTELVGAHGLCSEDPWIHGLNLGLTNGTGRVASSFHLDAQGHAVVATALAALVIDLFT
jgi:lysophospholipase L1-like esterase